MPPASVIHAFTVLAAAALLLLLRPAGFRLRLVGAVLGIGAFTGILAQLPTFYDGQVMPGGTFFLPFALISVISAVQMITTSRPVYAALHFVLVVLASSGLLVTLGAEFLGFAVVIVYAGAILITYMFVLMLAQQAQSPDLEDERPSYDRFAREPIGGAVVAFLLLAFMNHLIFTGTGQLTPGDSDPVPARMAAWERVGNMPGRMMELVVQVPGYETAVLPEKWSVQPDLDGLSATVLVMLNDAEEKVVLEGELARMAIEDNTRGVGVALIEAFPVSLELAGVVLTMAMFGAVILARRQIELTEDEKREASGLPRIGHHDDPKGGEVTHG
ncbi:MAG: hypothetical protein CMJ30_04560 [Phycisphaerae bacterium]|nr:hypothetical protein [Phycisphaerae bacterium]